MEEVERWAEGVLSLPTRISKLEETIVLRMWSGTGEG